MVRKKNRPVVEFLQFNKLSLGGFKDMADACLGNDRTPNGNDSWNSTSSDEDCCNTTTHNIKNS